ncbi:hypothetical protein C0583_00445 [Candidatus Parcubacteria bacterium]|nr:MAG: hypothetical protein C0583_00445 [Candidatus Parcubacteria bacterium]
MNDIKQKDSLLALRIAYAVWILIAPFGILYVPGKLFSGTATEVAQNILEHQWMLKLGAVSQLVSYLIYMIVVILFYYFFKSVSKRCVINLAIFSLVSIPISMLGVLGWYVALSLAGTNNDLMMIALDFSEKGMYLASIFWGLWLLPLASLTKMSGYFPSFISIALRIGAIGYLLGAFSQFLFENVDNYMQVFDLLTMGETVFVLWLVFMGAKLPKEN